MPKDEYSSIGGGALKLKGAKDGGIDKKRKKKKTPKPAADADASNPSTTSTDAKAAQPAAKEARDAVDDEELTLAPAPELYKTEAERRHEERRRKRLDERLKREGVKTHKERVEELNKYLSTLSEHHDMPRIGPG